MNENEIEKEVETKGESEKKSSMSGVKVTVLALAIVLVGYAGFLTGKTMKEKKQPEPAATAAVEQAESTADATVTTDPAAAATTVSGAYGIDLDALYAAHAPEDVVMTIGGKEVNWDSYYYFLNYYVNYYDTLFYYYGMSWSDVLDDEGNTGVDIVASTALDNCVMMAAIETMAEENSITLSEESLTALEEQVNSDRVSCVGEEGTQEEFEAYLVENRILPTSYERRIQVPYLYDQVFESLYANTVSDEEVTAWLEENSYVQALHILLGNTDAEGNALDEAAMAERKAQLEAVISELQAITDDAKRLARFKELVAEMGEDPGMEYYPDGYLFTLNEMVEPFDTAARALGDYEVSGIVETDYGYHVILRVPVDPNMVMDSSTGDTAAQTYQSSLMSEALESKMDSLEVVNVNGFELNLYDYYGWIETESVG